MFRESWQIPSPFMSNNLDEQFVGNSIVKLPQKSEKKIYGIFGGILLVLTLDTVSFVKNHLDLILKVSLNHIRSGAN